MIPLHIRTTLEAYRAARVAWLAACEKEEAYYIGLLHTPDTGNADQEYSELMELSMATVQAWELVESTREAYADSTAASI